MNEIREIYDDMNEVVELEKQVTTRAKSKAGNSLT